MKRISFYAVGIGILSSLLAACQDSGGTSNLSRLPNWAAEFRIHAHDKLPLGVTKRMRLTAHATNGSGLRQPYYGPVNWRIIAGDAVRLEDNGWIEGVKPGLALLEATSLETGFIDRIEVEVQDEPIQIYFQAPDNWQNAHIWYWYLEGDAHPSGRDAAGNPLKSVQPRSLGAWPGAAMKPVDGQPGWFYYEVPSVRSRELAGLNLVEQPVRIVFNNPSLGEKTRDMQHYDGCFLSYNKYLGDPAERLIDGRWDSPNNCRALPKKRRLLVKPPGGPVWNETYVDVDLSYGQLKDVRYSLGARPSDASQGTRLTGDERTIHLENKFFRNREELVLCVHAIDERDQRYQECFPYQLAGEGGFNNKLGADYNPDATTFSIWSPDRRNVELWLEGQNIPLGYIGDAVDIPGLYAVTVPGDHLLKRYHFVLDGVVVRDPYAEMATPGTDYNIVMDLSQISPRGGWAPRPVLPAAEDTIVYEMSIRDFTWDPSSGVTEGLRGTYLGSVERGTYLNKGLAGADPSIKTGLDHLIELGVTHVQLLPVFDSATCSVKDPDNGPDCYNWGYDPENWNVPEERFSQNPNDYIERVREFQTMVNEFHKAGIRVVMDVVYNHTWVRPWRESDEGEKYLGDITGKYFLADDEGFGYQLTGTGNTIDPTHPMASRLILDSLIHWIEVYGIDGFRFDLAGVFDHQKIEEWTNVLNERFPDRQLVFWGEPWTALDDPNPDHFRLYHMSRMKDQNGAPLEFGGYNFIYREAIKGFNDWGGGGGFAFNQVSNPQLILNGLRGSLGNAGINQASFASDPAQTINYASSHDNLTMFDKILAWSSIQGWQVPFDYQKRISGFANSIVMFSQGIPMIHSGAEMLRTKNGIYDSYRAPDAINRIDWNRKKLFNDVYQHYREAIQTRREFAGFRLETADDINRSVRSRFLDNGLFELRIAANARSSSELLVYLNSGPNRPVTLPDGRWRVRMEDTRAGDRRWVEGNFTLTGTAATVFYRN